MPSITYAICVCDEHRELHELLSFLVDTKRTEDDINILVDKGKCTDPVRVALKHFEKDITTHEREFTGDFSEHRNYHASLCKGDYIFVLDADEIPQEELMKHIREFTGDILYVPRINICPGYTKAFLEHHKFSVTNTGFINWPDYQGRYYKNNAGIRWTGGLHEKLTGGEVHGLEANPALALWHVKSVSRQNGQRQYYDGL
jgi:hypothetical protein